MFQNQSTFVDASKISNQNLNQEKDFKVADIPIHTMQKDIQEIENPSMKKILYPEKPIVKESLPELNEKQKSSPFLNPAEKTNSTDDIRLKTNPDYTQINKAIQPTMNSASHSNLFIAGIAMLIIILAGAGTYYFITLQQVPAETQENIAIPEISTETEISKTSISTDKPNYLVIDVAAADAASIKKSLTETAEKVATSGSTAPIEFIVVDEQNNPIGFSDFATKSNIMFSKKLIGLFEDDFSLFILNDNGTYGIGLNIKTNDSLSAKTEILQAEPLLYNDLASILPYSDFTPPTSGFQDASYKNYALRYQNLISSQKLSIDYAFQENNLVIATTKLTLESILDKSNPSQTP